ncbi:hypothetical protein [Natronorubrum daqingense]|uniref:Uncharacterized protein n=1 Tax=Natronorubrum daqingense TaxID=588898 RepID=A0A1N7G487_9EURY|nr:hypothetical protein [Natronorubrum daqingense]APX98745.1 hypothetical protein BB347_18745 [Natronorubrum daqingense]SIS07409.1 hypothetical protein SAMN05421809_3707 [Natronorubrum daqingense]
MSDRGPLSERALARTYESTSYTDAYETVEEYRRVMSYASRHPNKGSTSIASTFDLPRGRVRPWIEHVSVPDPVRAIETAREYGWLEADLDSPTFTALNTLVANVFSGGSISTAHYAPTFALNHHGEHSHVVDALESSNIEFDVIERDGRADEARPATDGTILGRTLAVLGAPVGPKAEQRLELPSYLSDAPEPVRERFVHSYLKNRAVEHNQKDTLTIQEERNRDYLESLCELIDSVVDERVVLGERHIVISADAARSLGTVR